MRSRPRFLPYSLEWAWLLLCLASLSIKQRGAEGFDAVDGTFFQRFSFVGVALLLVLLHLRRVPKFRLSPISLFLLYVIFGVASSLWSRSFIASLGKSVELLAAVLVVWITMARADADARLRRLVYLTVIEAVLASFYIIFGNIFDPADFREDPGIRGLFRYLWSSPLIASNSFSQLGALIGLFCLAQAFENKKRGASLFFMLCYLASATAPVLAQGRTGMVSFVVGTAVIVARRFPVSSIFAIPATAGLASILLGDTLLKLFVRGQDTQQLFSMSGRTTMWEAGWQAFFANPVFGAGFGVGSKSVMFALEGGRSFAQSSSLHNGPLEVLLGVGLVGFVIWACALIWSWWLTAAAYLRGDPLALTVGMVVPTTATFLSQGVGGPVDFFLQYFLAITAFLWLRQQQRVKATTGRATRLMMAGARPR